MKKFRSKVDYLENGKVGYFPKQNIKKNKNLYKTIFGVTTKVLFYIHINMWGNKLCSRSKKCHFHNKT